MKGKALNYENEDTEVKYFL